MKPTARDSAFRQQDTSRKYGKPRQSRPFSPITSIEDNIDGGLLHQHKTTNKPKGSAHLQEENVQYFVGGNRVQEGMVFVPLSTPATNANTSVSSSSAKKQRIV